MHSEEFLLKVENLDVQFSIDNQWYSAVKDISFSLKAGDSIGFIGESGCGKTVTALSLMRLIPKPAGRIASGKVFFKNKEISKLPINEFRNIRKNNISMIFQDPSSALNPVLKIGKQLMEAFDNQNTEYNYQKVLGLLNQVGLGDVERIIDAFPHQLSGGMKQRIMIAMALANDPDILIADEPTTSLDVTIQAQILDLLNKIKQQRSMALIFITHDLGIIARMCKYVYVMYAGRIIEELPINALFNSPIHPYTRGLLNIVNSLLASDTKKIETIEGGVLNLTDFEAGCAFRNRCKQVVKQCQTKHPPITKFTKQHCFACYNPSFNKNEAVIGN